MLPVLFRHIARNVSRWLVSYSILYAPFVVWGDEHGAPNPLNALGDPVTLTYSYSNYFDGGLSRAGGFTEFEMLQAAEEGLKLWSEVVPITFVERPDSGPDVDDDQYSQNGHPDIRIGHHDFGGGTLAHAFFPGTGGLASDVHLDSSNRTWTESLFFTTVTHELGHAIGLDHIDGVTSVMNTSLGGANIFPGIGNGSLFRPEIEAAQNIWGEGRGEVITTRVWNSSANGRRWSTGGNWRESWRPTEHANVFVQTDAVVEVSSRDAAARSVTLGGADNGLRLVSGGQLKVSGDVTMGTTDGGNPFVATGAAIQTLVPGDSSVASIWTNPEFDDSAWTRGHTGIGFDRSNTFDSLIQTDLESEMYNQNGTVYSRIEFDVSDPADLDFLTLRMKYDDGFVAYLNGTRVASANSPTNVRWNSVATGRRDDSEAVEFRDFDLTSSIPSLSAGRNVLAIQGLNRRANSSDMLMLPELAGGRIANSLSIDGGQLIVRGDLNVAQDSRSESVVEVNQGELLVRGNITQGAGLGAINISGGVLRVEGSKDENVLLAENSPVRFLVPASEELGDQWVESAFDDTIWSRGTTGLGFERETGFEPFIMTNLDERMFQLNSSFYSRMEFEVDDAESIGTLTLRMKFDDGFVAFLNGTRVAAENAPSELQWNSSAVRSVDDDEAVQFVDFDISQYVDLLVSGKNVLAVQGMNQSSGSSDLLMLPELAAREINGSVTIGELNFRGGQIHGMSELIGQFNHLEGAFSPSHPMSSGQRPGKLTIDGGYHMGPDAVLSMNLDGVEVGQFDRLQATGAVQLDGTIDIQVNENGGQYGDPTERGTAHVVELITATEVVDRFDTLIFDGDELRPGHQGDGLFRSLFYTSSDVSLVNYLAIPGDADGNGQFNSSDLISVFQSGEYEDGIDKNSDWTEGDWTGDGEFNSQDFIVAFQSGSYESGSVFAAAAPVPEPGILMLLATSGIGVLWRRKFLV